MVLVNPNEWERCSSLFLLALPENTVVSTLFNKTHITARFTIPKQWKKSKFNNKNVSSTKQTNSFIATRNVASSPNSEPHECNDHSSKFFFSIFIFYFDTRFLICTWCELIFDIFILSFLKFSFIYDVLIKSVVRVGTRFQLAFTVTLRERLNWTFQMERLRCYNLNSLSDAAISCVCWWW